MIEITCRCGHKDDWDAFREVWNGELPDGHFQCPSCNRAWTVKREPATVLSSGFIMPGKQRIVNLDPVLSPCNQALTSNQ